MSIHREPFFRYWRYRFLTSYGDDEIRVDGIHMYGRDGGPDLVPFAVDEFYNVGSYVDGVYIADIADQPHIGFEFEYGIVPRLIELDYSQENSYEFAPVWNAAAAGNNNLNKCAYSPTLNRFTVLMNSAAGSMYSADGITWVNGSGLASNSCERVKWIPELGIFLACFTTTPTGLGSRFARSADGISWVASGTVTTGTWYDFDWNPILNQIVAVSSAGAVRFGYSADGISWTTASPSITTHRSIKYGAGCLCIGSASLGEIRRSTDGTTWTLMHTVSGGSNFRCAAYSPELNVFIVGVAPNGAYGRSADGGSTWQTHTIPGASSITFEQLDWFPELQLFVGCSSSATFGIFTSPDGINWTVIFTGRHSLGVAYSSAINRFIGVNNTMSNARVSYNDTVAVGVGIADAPRDFILEASHDRREWFEIKSLEFVPDDI